MQLVKVHTSYSRAIGKVNSLVAAGSPEVCVLAFYDGTATPSQRWDALKPFLDIFGDTLLQRFSSAWTPDAIAFFSQQVGGLLLARAYLSLLSACH